MRTPEIAPLGEMPLNKKFMSFRYRHIASLDKRSIPEGHNIFAKILCPSEQLAADRQLQLFQLFHFRHALPGFSFAAFLRLSHKAASFSRVFSLNAFFIPYHLLPLLAFINKS
jgi:hypothetical protein